MTTEQVQTKLAEHNIPWEQFLGWMRGQTAGLYPDGSTNWYDYDVNRFIKHTLRGTKESSAEWD